MISLFLALTPPKNAVTQAEAWYMTHHYQIDMIPNALQMPFYSSKCVIDKEESLYFTAYAKLYDMFTVPLSDHLLKSPYMSSILSISSVYSSPTDQTLNERAVFKSKREHVAAHILLGLCLLNNPSRSQEIRLC